MKYAEIAVNVPLDRTFTYSVPDELAVEKLCRVRVNFKGAMTEGFVLKILDETEFTNTGGFRIKPIHAVLDASPIIDENTLKIAAWMAAYYLEPLGATLSAITPSAVRPKPYLHKTAHSGALPVLNAEQLAAFREIEKSFTDPSAPRHFLLYGVTGSGKTEVYKHLVRKTLDMGKSALVLIPEIALTPQTLERFYDSFGTDVAIYHSRLTGSQRLGEWIRALEGRARVIIGPRSAVFAPVRELGLIIIDEEHETSYKAGNAPRYHARQVAWHRAHSENALLVLGSATPQVETYFHSEPQPGGTSPILKRVELNTRYSSTPLPEVEVMDMRGRKNEGNVIAPELLQKMLTTVNSGRQVMLFLNRRGFSPVLMCKDCGHTFECPSCNVSLTFHKSQSELHCHHCGLKQPVPMECPSCGSLALSDIGTGTERVEFLLNETFINRRILRMDLDTTRERESYERILSDFRKGKADILVGTQMIAKGHDIPGVQLVGVLLPDIILNIPDFRSSERTFILLTQVIGRAGRRDTQGQAFIETYNPETDAIVYAARQDFKGFYKVELTKREAFFYPPFCRIGRLVFRGEDRQKMTSFLSELQIFVRKNCRSHAAKKVLGPVSCPVEKLKNNYRYHIIIKCNNIREITEDLRKIRDFFQAHGDARHMHLEIDIDPMSLI